MEIDQIRNGIWLKAPWPYCWRAQVQWIEKDVWILLCEEQPAMHDGACRIARQCPSGGEWKTLMTKVELFEYVNGLPWQIEWKDVKHCAHLAMVEKHAPEMLDLLCTIVKYSHQWFTSQDMTETTAAAFKRAKELTLNLTHVPGEDANFDSP